MSAQSAGKPLSHSADDTAVHTNTAHDEHRDRGEGRKKRTAGARWKMPAAIIVGGIFSAVLAAINGLQLASLERALGGLKTPEAQLGGYDAGYIALIRFRMTDELLERYGASHYLWDLLFPLVFAATIVMLIAYICAGRKRQWLLMLAPILFAAVDIAENLTLEALMIAPSVDVTTVTLAAVLTVMKVAFFAMSVVAALLALLTRPKKS